MKKKPSDLNDPVVQHLMRRLLEDRNLNYRTIFGQGSHPATVHALKEDAGREAGVNNLLLWLDDDALSLLGRYMSYVVYPHYGSHLTNDIFALATFKGVGPPSVNEVENKLRELDRVIAVYASISDEGLHDLPALLDSIPSYRKVGAGRYSDTTLCAAMIVCKVALVGWQGEDDADNPIKMIDDTSGIGYISDADVMSVVSRRPQEAVLIGTIIASGIYHAAAIEASLDGQIASPLIEGAL